MASKSLPSQATLLQLLRYEPETGKLFWRERPLSMFADGGHSAAHTCARWNSRFARKEAFTAKQSAGYRHSNLGGEYLLAHRVIWKMETGEEPNDVDHIDGVRDNNRWHNLRSVTREQNLKNASRHKDNLSGATGVRWAKSCSKWQAFITSNYRVIILGTFERFEDAVAARKAAEREHNFHANHGRSPSS
jgi:hypothetical protein